MAQRPLFGGRFELDLSRSATHRLLYLEGERFVGERFQLQPLLRRGMTAVDVGANLGYYALLFQQRVGPTGRVICIEPSVENLPELENNLRINVFRNVVLHRVALGDADGEIGLRSGINSGVTDDGAAAHIVPIRRLDALVQERVDFLKIDVEGYEGQVLRGAATILDRDRPILFLELHPGILPRFGHTAGEIISWLRNYYTDIRVFDDPQTGALFKKFLVRYLGRDPLYEERDIDRYLDGLKDCSTEKTFWAVCRPQMGQDRA